MVFIVTCFFFLFFSTCYTSSLLLLSVTSYCHLSSFCIYTSFVTHFLSILLACHSCMTYNLSLSSLYENIALHSNVLFMIIENSTLKNYLTSSLMLSGWILYLYIVQKRLHNSFLTLYTIRQKKMYACKNN